MKDRFCRLLEVFENFVSVPSLPVQIMPFDFRSKFQNHSKRAFMVPNDVV